MLVLVLNFVRGKIFRSLVALSIVFASSVIGAPSVNADTGAPPNGVNLGFRYVGSPTTTIKGKAAFLLSDSTGLDLCGNTGGNCSFDFRYKINGTFDTQVAQAAAFSYKTWPTIDGTNQNAVHCQGSTNGPLTNYNCFNTNGFGQVFSPASSGAMTEFSMAMACLSPTGSTNLTAYLYEASAPAYTGGAGTADSNVISSALAQASVPLTHCSTSWSAKAFSDSDFVFPAISFGSINLDSSKYYVVLFTGDAVAGVQPSAQGSNTQSSNNSNSSQSTAAQTVTTPSPEPSPALAKTGVTDSPLLAIALILMFFGYTAYSIGFEEMRKARVLKWLGLDWLDFKFK